jgi:hypothetical protein
MEDSEAKSRRNRCSTTFSSDRRYLMYGSNSVVSLRTYRVSSQQTTIQCFDRLLPKSRMNMITIPRVLCCSAERMQIHHKFDGFLLIPEA